MDKSRLIFEVRKRPILWNFDSEKLKYPRGQNPPKADMWKEVAACMGPDVTVENCKHNWKTLRDTYRKHSKRIEQRLEKELLNGKHDYKYIPGSKWVYFEHLKFLEDSKKRRPKVVWENINSSSDGIGDDDYDDDDAMDNNALEIQSQDVEILKENRQQPAQKSPTFFSKDDTENEAQSLLNYTHLDKIISNDFVPASDSNYNFLLSFVPLMQKMDDMQCLLFRAKITELIYNLMSQPDMLDVSSS